MDNWIGGASMGMTKIGSGMEVGKRILGSS